MTTDAVSDKVAPLMRLIDAYRDTWGGRPGDPKEMRAAVERELTAALTAQPSAHYASTPSLTPPQPGTTVTTTAAPEEFVIPCADDVTFQESHAQEPAPERCARQQAGLCRCKAFCEMPAAASEPARRGIVPYYSADALEAARKQGMEQERALWMAFCANDDAVQDAKDAARYQWLRDNREWQHKDGSLRDVFYEDGTLCGGADLDDAIDAAIAAQGTGDKT